MKKAFLIGGLVFAGISSCTSFSLETIGGKPPRFPREERTIITKSNNAPVAFAVLSAGCFICYVLLRNQEK